MGGRLIKQISSAAFWAIMFCSGSTFAGLLWHQPNNLKRQWGSVDVVTTAQYLCAQLKENGNTDWRLPTENELLNAPRNNLSSGVFWSAYGVPFLIKHKPMAVAVDIQRREPLFREPHTQQLVVCVHD